MASDRKRVGWNEGIMSITAASLMAQQFQGKDDAAVFEFLDSVQKTVDVSQLADTVRDVLAALDRYVLRSGVKNDQDQSKPGQEEVAGQIAAYLIGHVIRKEDNETAFDYLRGRTRDIHAIYLLNKMRLSLLVLEEFVERERGYYDDEAWKAAEAETDGSGHRSDS